jgi:hypothetical protein
MDPALTGIITPWAQLGIVGSVVLALGATVYMQWQHIKTVTAAHLADVKAFGEKYADVLIKKSEATTTWQCDRTHRRQDQAMTSPVSAAQGAGGRRGCRAAQAAAIQMLAEKLTSTPADRFEQAMRDLIDADKKALEEKGR